MTFDIEFCRGEVDNMIRLLGSNHVGKVASWSRTEQTASTLRVCWRYIMRRHKAKIRSFTEIKHSEFCFTQSRRVCQQGREDRVQLTLRAGYDSQYLGGRRLLLQRFAQI